MLSKKSSAGHDTPAFRRTNSGTNKDSSGEKQRKEEEKKVMKELEAIDHRLKLIPPQMEENEEEAPIPQKATIIPTQIFSVPKLDMAKVATAPKLIEEHKELPSMEGFQAFKLSQYGLESSINCRYLQQSIKHNMKGSQTDTISFIQETQEITINLSKQAKSILIKTKENTMQVVYQNNPEKTQ